MMHVAHQKVKRFELFNCCKIRELDDLRWHKSKTIQIFRESLPSDSSKYAEIPTLEPQRFGTTVISRRASIRLSSGGCVLNRDETVPPPNNGFTMHKVEVDGEIEVVGIRLL